MKKLLYSLLCFLTVFTFITGVKAEEAKREPEKVNVYMFTKEGCSYCEDAAEYFSKLASDKEYGEMFNIITLKVYNNKWDIVNQEFYELALKVSKKMGDKFGGTPYIIVGEKSFNGFDKSFDEDIKKEIKRCYEDGYEDPLANIDAKKDPEDPDKGMKIFLGTIMGIAFTGTVIGLIISRLPKKNKASKEIKKETEEKPKETIKPMPKAQRVNHNAPKAKSSTNKNKTKK